MTRALLTVPHTRRTARSHIWTDEDETASGTGRLHGSSLETTRRAHCDQGTGAGTWRMPFGYTAGELNGSENEYMYDHKMIRPRD